MTYLPITNSSDPGEIELLQRALMNQGFEIAVDGVFGPKTAAAVRTFQANHELTVDGVVGKITWNRLTAMGAVVPVPAGVGPFAGFDTYHYPGDRAMRIWKEWSRYRFVGYYLKAPCHTISSWTGNRVKIQDLGWGIVVIYVGRQSQGPGSAVPPSRELGIIDGQDALRKAGAEGFEPQTIVYLDVEPMDRIPQAQIEYVNGWLAQFSGTGFLPGIYCHIKNATRLRAAITEVPPDQVNFWVSGSGAFDPETSRPADSGIGFAHIWQGTFNQTRSFSGVTMQIDENVADRASPSAPPVPATRLDGKDLA